MMMPSDGAGNRGLNATDLPRSLHDHACWRAILPMLRVELGSKLASGHAHRRIELDASSLEAWQVTRLIGVRVPCAACGEAVCPFRERRGKRASNAGRTERPGRLYVSVACELSVNVGCARGSAASAELDRIIAAVEAARAPRPARAMRQLELGAPTQWTLRLEANARPVNTLG